MTATPNRMKFASLAGKLDPLDPEYVNKVAGLAADYNRRELLKDALIHAYTAGEVEDKVYLLLGDSVFGLSNTLDNHIRAAIERFVMDCL